MYGLSRLIAGSNQELTTDLTEAEAVLGTKTEPVEITLAILNVASTQHLDEPRAKTCSKGFKSEADFRFDRSRSRSHRPPNFGAQRMMDAQKRR